MINDGAEAYRGVIAADCWKEPYMPRDELCSAMDDGILFWAWVEVERLSAVMGLQHVSDVSLIRHAYTRTGRQGRGFGAALLSELQGQTTRPLLVGTWRAAWWAITFYQRRGFQLVTPEQKVRLLRRYWTVPDRQIEESVVLADNRARATLDL